MKTNNRPRYYAQPYIHTHVSGKQERIPHLFNIMEYRDGEMIFICKMSNEGDRLNNILKRGIPYDDAKNVFYQMDEN